MIPIATVIAVKALNVLYSDNDVISQQWSNDHAFKATVMQSSRFGHHSYVVRIDALPGHHPPVVKYLTDSGWFMNLPLFEDEDGEGPVAITWDNDRKLAITVVTTTLRGTLSQTAYDLHITTTYEPRTS